MSRARMSGSARLGTRAHSTLGPSPRGEVADGLMFSSAKSRIHRAGESGSRIHRVVSGCSAWPPLCSHLGAERNGSSEPRPRSRGLFMDGLLMWAISGRVVPAPGACRDHHRGGGSFRETSAKVAKVAVKPRHRERLVLGTDISAPQSGKSKRSVTKNAYRSNVGTSYSPHFVFCEVWPRRQCDEPFAQASDMLPQLLETGAGRDFALGMQALKCLARPIIRSGEGYSLMWPKGDVPRRYEWQAGSMIVPPNMWLHQHFNTGTTPARYLAFKHEVVSIRNAQGVPKAWISRRIGGDQIDYADETPEVRRIFAEALSRHGLTPKMDAAYEAELADLPPLPARSVA